MKIKKLTIVLTSTLSFLLLIFSVNAQNPIWTLPDQIINFSNPPFITQPLPQNGNGYFGAAAQNTHNAISDAQGELLFFQVDESVYDKNGQTIGSFDVDVKGNSETLIVPDPADCERYYIFSSKSNLLNSGAVNFQPTVALLDMSNDNCNIGNPSQQNSVYGKFVQVNAPNNQSIPLNSNASVDFKLRLLPNSNSLPSTNVGHFGFAPQTGRNILGAFNASSLLTDTNGNPYRWVWLTNGRVVFAMKVTTNGLEFVKTNVFDAIPIPGQNEGDNILPNTQRYEMDVVQLPNGNFRFACVINSALGQQPPNQPSLHDGVSVFDVDQNMNIVPGSHQRFDYLSVNSSNHTKIPGLEFSPSGGYLFISHSINTIYSNALDVVNLQTAITYPINFQGANDFSESQIELGPDGKMYFINNNRMATFSNPNLAVFGFPPVFPVQVCPNCWNNNEVSINGYNATSGLSPSDNVYTLPRQIEGVNIQSLTSGGEKFYTASGTQTWSPNFNPINNANGQSGVNTVVIHCELRITAGADITINNMEFQFGPNGKVVIERGANGLKGGRLTINNTTFTNTSTCKGEDYWQGVEVFGDIFQLQNNYNNSNQGWFRVRNNSVITNARIGITASGGQTNPNILYGGGVIEAQNSSFINNKMDVQFFPYNSMNINGSNTNLSTNNKSFFRRCDFLTNGLLINSNDFTNVHADIFYNSGVLFTACNFENQTPSLYQDFRRSIGIRVTNAYTKVSEQGIGFVVPTTFKNLYYGCYINNPQSTIYGFDCRKSDFINNQFGIRMNSVQGAQVVLNNFEVSRENPSNSPYGMYLLGCNRYEIEENNFTSFNSSLATFNDNTYGIVVDNSINANLNSCNLVFDDNQTALNPTEIHFYEERIYKNNFTQLNVGVQSQDNNVLPLCPDPTSPNLKQYGLEFRCNNFESDIFDADISINAKNNSIPDEVSHVQGTCLNSSAANPAGNSFSYTGTPASDIYVYDPQVPNSNAIEYKYTHHTGSPYTPLEFTAFTASVTNGVNLTSCVPFDNSCPSNIRVIGSVIGSVVIGNGIFNRNRIDSLYNQIDGGQYNQLITDISNLPDWQLRNQLVDQAPYLSDQVLITLINSGRPEWVVQPVLEAHAPLTSNVMIKLINSSQNYSANIIRNLALQSSPLEKNVMNALVDRTPALPDWVIEPVMNDNSPLWDETLLKLLNRPTPVANYAVRNIFQINTPLSSSVQDQFMANNYPTWVVNAVIGSSFVAGNPNDKNFNTSIMQGIMDEAKLIGEQIREDEFQLIDFFLKDTTIENGVDSLIDFLSDKKSIYYQQMLFETYLIKNDTANASNVIDSLASKLDQATLKAMSIQLDHSGSLADCFKIKTDTILRDKTESLLGDYNRRACAKAEALLAFADDTLFNAFIAPVIINNSTAIEQNNSNKIVKTSVSSNTIDMNNKPNPYAEETFINVNIEEPIFNEAKVVVYDVMGRIIESYKVEQGKNQLIHKAGNSKGVVFYSLFIDGQLKATEKMLILE